MTDENPVSAPESADEPVVTPKRRRGRPRKSEVAAQTEPTLTEEVKPRRGRPRKSKTEVADSSASTVSDTPAVPKRRRGRPRKSETEAAARLSEADALERSGSAETAPAVETADTPTATEAHASASVASESSDKSATKSASVAAAPKRRRGRPRKSESVEEEMNRLVSEASVASSEPTAQPVTTIAATETETGLDESGSPSATTSIRVHRRHTSDSRDSGDSQQQGKGVVRENYRDRRQNNQRNNKRRPQTPSEPSLTREMLEGMKVAELRTKAAEYGLTYLGVRKPDLIEMIYSAAAAAEGFRTVEGILQIGPEGYGWVRTGNYMEGDDDAFVHQQIIRYLGLRQGDKITGTVGPGRSNSKYPPLHRVLSVNDGPVENLKARPRFRDLTPIFPDEPLKLEHGKNSITGRAIDLVAPIGKGQRGLIVSPPKAGKTTILKKICQSISENNPEVYLFCLLVDERPEEVTDMERSIKGTVVASTFDMPAENHTAVSELVIERAKRLVEQGQDVVVILDSITRLARAYNLAIPASGRILSGGVDSAALYPPKKFLGAARNIEGGGSLTIIASALVDTGSKMDEVIFEEFKGTGNMELKLDRDLADRRIFPAIDPVASGTRNEDLLIKSDYQPLIWGLRRSLANMPTTERATSALIKGLQQTSDNEDFLIRSAKRAAELA